MHLLKRMNNRIQQLCPHLCDSNLYMGNLLRNMKEYVVYFFFIKYVMNINKIVLFILGKMFILKENLTKRR